MKIIKTPVLAICSLFLLAGCQYFQFPGVHKINIQQGHIITKEMISQLEPGMNKRQVRYILGTPLINDMFGADRWDYYYSLKMGDGRFYKRQLTLHFDGDKYTHYTGENLPDMAKDDSDGEAGDKENAPAEPATPLPTND